MEEHTICRRLEIHDLPSSVFIHILQQAVEAAQKYLHGNVLSKDSQKRFDLSWGIRVVIDDFRVLKNTYVDIRDEPLLLRFLVFHLGREGVTTLLIDTQSGRPDTMVATALDSELRSLVENRIYTWRFPFYGENRVAIAAIPPVSPTFPLVIRELRQGRAQGTGPDAAPLFVDPHFELYKGIEKGEPEPVALEIKLFEETPGVKTYIDYENERYIKLFAPHASSDLERGRYIIFGAQQDDYDKLRDLSYIQSNTQLDHTLVIQIDEFWLMQHPDLRRTGAYRSQWQYLNTITSVKSEIGGLEKVQENDPFRLFQETSLDEERVISEIKRDRSDRKEFPREIKHRRRNEFVFNGYEPNLADNAWIKNRDTKKRDTPEKMIDRIPFMWDFGFLLCKLRSWTEHSGERLSFSCKADEKGGMVWRNEKFKTVGDVWKALPKATKDGEVEGNRPPWRAFLEACYHVAKAEAYAKSSVVSPFDVYVSASPTLACLILEIWASEIYNNPNHRDALVKQVSERKFEHSQIGLVQWLTDYQLEFFKTWLLLVEAMNLGDHVQMSHKGNLKIRKPESSTVAVRHWYKTACRYTEDQSLDEPVVPAGLPGHFSVRGDWFLAVAGGSRSARLADLALDLLSSRRANYTRLKLGLGLPTRRIVYDQLRTGLFTFDRGDKEEDFGPEEISIPGKEDKQASKSSDSDNRSNRTSRVLYKHLIRLGGKVMNPFNPLEALPTEGDFFWLWRSGLAHYHLQAKLWEDWLSQMIVWWTRMRYVDKDEWQNGFTRYDEIVESGNRPDCEALKIRAWSLFQARCNYLIKELKQATPFDIDLV